ncbi:hypothetical protein MMC13_001591 [Lambiella insularis]|nr:hypothetical protein [Lambiella insularis]
MISSSTEIAAPPESVREILLDFPAIPTWHTGYIKSITARAKPPYTKDDPIEGHMGGVDFHATILESSAHLLSWTGPALHGLFRGIHSFRFVPSQIIPGGTTFTQEEAFEGWMAWVFMPWGPLGRMVRGYFEGFNQDLKRRCERGEGKE